MRVFFVRAATVATKGVTALSTVAYCKGASYRYYRYGGSLDFYDDSFILLTDYNDY
jgi:hypothetical protein